VSFAAEVKSKSGLSSKSDARHGGPHRLAPQLGGEGVVLHDCEVLEQAAEGERRRAYAGLQACLVEAVRLPAERRPQSIEGTDEVLGLGARKRRLPRKVRAGYGVVGRQRVRLEPVPDDLRPESAAICHDG
jgi:hypothetical protein